MSLRTVLMSLVVAGVLAGLVLISLGIRGSGGGVAGAGSRTIGVDAVSVVEVRVESAEMGIQVARRQAGTVDGWVLQLTEDESDVWGGDAARIRTVLRALATASFAVVDDDELGDLYGALRLTAGDGMMIEVRFGQQAAGGFVRAEVVERGEDGIATSRWFGRVERGVRDSLFDEGINEWRSMGLFDFTMSDVFGVRVSAGGHAVGLSRFGGGWRVVEPWTAGADSGMVQGMLGLVLGLRAERIYEGGVYTDDLTGLGEPVARIVVDGRDSETRLEIGSAVESSGKEVFARYTVGEGRSVVVAIKTEGLNRLTASALAYVHQTASEMGRADIGAVRIMGSDGSERFVCESRLDSWEVDGVVVSPSQRAAIDRLVGVLTAEKAGRVFEFVDGEEPSGTLIGRIELVSRDGGVESFGVLIESGEGGIRLLLSRGVGDGKTLVWVCGSAEAGGTGAWVGALVAGGEE